MPECASGGGGVTGLGGVSCPGVCVWSRGVCLVPGGYGCMVPECVWSWGGVWSLGDPGGYPIMH